MYCPKCGQQQVSNDVRFCSRCGFLLEGVHSILASGGLVPRYAQPGNQPLSPRSKGVRQGALLMLSTLIVVPVIAILGVGVLDLSGAIVALAAVLCVIGGLLRMIYALMMEDPYPQTETNQMTPYVPPGASQFDRSGRNAALPPSSINPASAWRPRPNTSELVHPPSVTENTTRLLEKDDSNSQ